MRKFSVQSPWLLHVSLAKTIIYFSLSLTLFLNESSTLFGSLYLIGPGPHCSGASSISVFCLVDENAIDLMMKVSAVLVIIAATGYFPRYTGLLAAYISFSLGTTLSLIEGGEQVSFIILLLLLPHTLLDRRRNHFHSLKDSNDWAYTAARVSVISAQIQIAVVYFFAAIGKMQSADWKNGSAIYYWVRHVDFAPADWLMSLVAKVSSYGLLVQVITWGAILLELALAFSIFWLSPAKKLLLITGVIFHVSIAFIHGIPSFSITMIGCLVLLLGASIVAMRSKQLPLKAECEAVDA